MAVDRGTPQRTIRPYLYTEGSVVGNGMGKRVYRMGRVQGYRGIGRINRDSIGLVNRSRWDGELGKGH